MWRLFEWIGEYLGSIEVEFQQKRHGGEEKERR